jgi:hypothetical protein
MNKKLNPTFSKYKIQMEGDHINNDNKSFPSFISAKDAAKRTRDVYHKLMCEKIESINAAITTSMEKGDWYCEYPVDSTSITTLALNQLGSRGYKVTLHTNRSTKTTTLHRYALISWIDSDDCYNSTLDPRERVVWSQQHVRRPSILSYSNNYSNDYSSTDKPPKKKVSTNTVLYDPVDPAYPTEPDHPAKPTIVNRMPGSDRVISDSE